MEYVAIVRRKAVRPVAEASVTPHPFHLRVTFADGERREERDNGPLRMFLAALQDVTFERVEGDTSHCVPVPLTGPYRLLGMRAGDAFHCHRGDVSFPIVLS